MPYVAISIFITGFLYRVFKWSTAPVPFHIAAVYGQQKSLPGIKPDRIESPNSTRAVIVRMAMEMLFFRSLFRNDKVELKNSTKLIFGGNKYLWLGSLIFHWSLLIILFRHMRFVLEPIPAVVRYIQNIDGVFQFALPALYITDLLIVVSLTYLLLRRVVFSQVRYISLTSDYFTVLLLLSVLVSGILMRHVYRIDVVGAKELAMGIVTFHPVIPEGLGLSFYVHLTLVCTLIAYFPFSKLLHAPGILFSPTRNLRNDSRMHRYRNPWSYPVKVHTYDEWENEFQKQLEQSEILPQKENYS